MAALSPNRIVARKPFNEVAMNSRQTVENNLKQWEREERRYFWFGLAILIASFVIGILVGQKVGM